MKLGSSIEPSIYLQSEYWLARIKSYSIRYTKEQLTQKRTPRLSEVWSAAYAMFRQANGNTVKQEEYNRRSEICRNCELVSDVSVCVACGGGGKISAMIQKARSYIKDKTFKLDDKTQKKYCGVCGCWVPLLALTETDYLPKEDVYENKARPLNCWMRKDSKNYKP